MPAKIHPTGNDALNLSSLSALFTDEDKAREFLESQRWPDGKPICPHCGGEGYALIGRNDSKNPTPPGVKKCKGCRKKFTVRIGTIFEESRLPLSKWLMAFHLMTSSKKSISAHQIARELDVTVKTAWFLCHRIREAMRTDGGPLTGTVELDETYVGGKPRFKGQSKRGRGADKKKPVMVLVERDGNAKAIPVERVDSDTLKGVARLHVAPEATIMTDEWPSYTGLGNEFAGHEVVCHSKGEYARGDVNTNTAESFFALLKTGLVRYLPLVQPAAHSPLLQ